VLLWALFLLAITAMGILAKWLTPTLRPGPGGVGLVQVALQLGMLLMILPFAVRVRGDALGLRRLPAPRDGLVLLFPTLSVMIGFSAGFRHVEVPTLILAFASVVLAGVAEETAFRGILLTRLLPRGPWTAEDADGVGAAADLAVEAFDRVVTGYESRGCLTCSSGWSGPRAWLYGETVRNRGS
jgi:membrane protease YdiL (CAAX protease family)